MDNEYNGSHLGIDLLGEQVQPMSDLRPTHATLQETAYFWLRGTTLFFCSDLSTLTYKDFVDHIGCDASEYYYDAKLEARCYIWVASDKPEARFLAQFRQKLDGWAIAATGAAQVTVPEEYINQFKKQQRGELNE